MDSISTGETSGKKIGKRIVLPPSFIGGPRNMRRRYLDAMALVQKFGKPDIFLTVTCNPAWSEIKDQLGHHEEAQNRPDLIARVFKAKIEELKIDLLKKNIFGAIAAHVYVVEFQKRGLPHAHFLLILKHKYKLKTLEMYDKFVSAELPNSRSYPHLYKMVVQHMMHGPCGNLNPNNVCMRNGKCKNHYPREFCSVTTQTRNSYPLYKRQNTGEEVKVRGCFLDNRWVVPYNPYLLAKFNCHMNVEVCSTVKAVKYLYKYIYKGHDRVMFHLADNDVPEDIDEIQQFQQARWISPPEAMWRIYQFCLNEMYPSVKSLQVHLENMQTVGFREDTNLLSILQNQQASKTMLTGYFQMNQLDKEACRFLYKEFPEYYVWNEDKKYWSRRKQRNTIGRLVAASPVEGERYYLRLLLNHVKGATSYQSLQTINGIKFDTFRKAAEQYGLLESDNNIDQCLEEASLFHMPFTLRRLFATLLVYCGVHNPAALWDKYKDAMSEDFAKTNFMSARNTEAKALQSINYFLESMGKSIIEYALPAVMIVDNPDEKLLKEIHEELNIPISENELFTIQNLNPEQKRTYTIILERIRSDNDGVFFIDGPGGTGKTYLYRALLIAVRSEGHIALATATSGIAASILPGGRTAHSRFKLPLNFEERSTCNISKQSGLAELLRRAKLIIWDEASMANRRAIEALNVMLQDITDCKLLFGGKVVIFGGDFRQIPPVVIRGGKKETIDASLVMSELWKKIQKIELTENMRAKIDPHFSEFLLRIGNGTEITISEERIQIPKTMLIPYTDDISSKFELINSVFPNLIMNGYDSHFMTNRAILTTKNEFVDELNQILIEQFPGDSIKYYSFDSAVDEAQQNLPEEFLNGLTPSGLPPHELILKKNCPVILLRNIDPSSGLCNGTRLICRNFQKNVLDAEIIVGHHEGKRVFLPQIPLQSDQDEKFPLPFKRKQFPIRLSFAMTINKSQGQTLENVGIYLPQPVFSHGQLYVALSRVRSGEAIKILINPSSNNKNETSYTRNVVYGELLALASNNK